MKMKELPAGMKDKLREAKGNWKVLLLSLLLVLNSIIMVVFCMVTVKSHQKMSEVRYEMSYLSDTTSLMLDDISTMKSDIRKSMEEQSSYLESWEINLESMQFAEKTYTVDIHIIPKEWTETTGATIYFGTKSFPLKLDRYQFSGRATLPLNTSYTGNVAVLFEDGNSRKTEVLENYTNVAADLDQVLYGTLFEDPSYENGKLALPANGYLRLEGGNFFVFDSLELVVEANDAVLRTFDLRAMAAGERMNEDTGETEAPDDREILLKELTSLAYSFSLDGQLDLDPGCRVRMYLRSTSDSGYIFTYDLFVAQIEADPVPTPEIAAPVETTPEPVGTVEETVGAQSEKAGHIVPETIDHQPHAAVYDPDGGVYEIEQNK